MNLVHKVQPRFPTGPLTTLDMPLNSGFMSGVLVQDRSQAQNHGTATNSPVPRFPGFEFTAASSTKVAGSDVLSGGVYPVTMACWCEINDEIQRCAFGVGQAATSQYLALKNHPDTPNTGWTYGFFGRSDGMPTSNVRGPDAGQQIGKWVCIVGTASALGVSNMRYYLNGVEYTDAGGGDIAECLAANDGWGIGVNANDLSTDFYFDGKVGDCIFERRVWTPAEAKSFFELTRYRYGV